MNDDQWTREILNEAVAGVEPRRALEGIQHRTTAVRRTRKTWSWAAAGAAAAVVATVAGFAVVNSGGTQRGDEDPGIATTPTASDDPTAPTTQEELVLPVYYAGPTPTGPRLFREFHRTITGDPALSAVKAALMEPAIDPDYYSIWTKVGAQVESVGQADGLITIDLHTNQPAADLPAGVSEADAGIAIEQVIYTAQGALLSGNDVPVQITLDGNRALTLLGVPVNEPLAAGDPMSVQGTVWITSPQDGATLPSGTRVEGRGAFGEANVSWELIKADEPGKGKIVRVGFAMAEECCTLSPYSFVLEAPPGNYVLRVYDADMSGGEGPGEAEDTKQITVE